MGEIYGGMISSLALLRNIWRSPVNNWLGKMLVRVSISRRACAMKKHCP